MSAEREDLVLCDSILSSPLGHMVCGPPHRGCANKIKKMKLFSEPPHSQREMSRDLLPSFSCSWSY